MNGFGFGLVLAWIYASSGGHQKIPFLSSLQRQLCSVAPEQIHLAC